MNTDEKGNTNTPDRKRDLAWLVNGVLWKVKTVGSALYWKVILVRNATYHFYKLFEQKIIIAWNSTTRNITVFRNHLYWSIYYSDRFSQLLTTIYIRLFLSRSQKNQSDLEKFVLVTRGRSGSTAILDTLGKIDDACVTQENFLLHPFTDKKEDFLPLSLPFDLWKHQVKWWRKLLPSCLRDISQANQYLKYMEELALSQGTKFFGWKVLSHNLEERPYLSQLLKLHGYKVVYLKRKLSRQVISGMVANHRGIYNTVDHIEDEHRYKVDIVEFQWHFTFEKECVMRDKSRLASHGFHFIEVDYEVFCSNREMFFGKICDFLHMPTVMPPASEYKKVIQDLRKTIENFDEVAQSAAALGEFL